MSPFLHVSSLQIAPVKIFSRLSLALQSNQVKRSRR